MNKCGKTAWLIGSHENPNVEEDLVEKGYTLRKFNTGKEGESLLYDDQPDMIIFSEDILHKDSLFYKVNDFFPGTIVVSIGSTQPQETDDDALAISMERLINSLKGITQA